MPKYNIIFTSPDDDTYLWNETSFDKLENAGNDVLRFSGKAFEEDELKDALKQAIEAAKKMFPGNKEPVIKVVEIKVV
jgi:hypothetical protein